MIFLFSELHKIPLFVSSRSFHWPVFPKKKNKKEEEETCSRERGWKDRVTEKGGKEETAN